MALRPPDDFTLAAREPARPSDAELRQRWEREEATRRQRQRAAEWRSAREQLRRDASGELRPVHADNALPAYVRDRLAFGPHACAALRPVPREGRVPGAGVDTWSPCWYAEPGSPLARAMGTLASEPTRRARLLPNPVAGHRVGWFPEPRLVFAEGRPGGERLLPASALPEALRCLEGSLADIGVPVTVTRCAGLRRLDVAADVWTDGSAEGLALLEVLASAAPGAGKVCAYRVERRVESVLLKSRAGRTLARLYDKGPQSRAAPPGRWLRFEAQWRFPRGERPAVEHLDGPALRERFARRFSALWQAAGGSRLGAVDAVGEKVGAAVRSGQLLPSRARSLIGYLVLSAAGVPQGARRTTYELERECRELGLSVSLLRDTDRRVDIATVLDECLSSEIWR